MSAVRLALQLALLGAPFIGVGVLRQLGIAGPGVGLQPAYVAGLFLWAALLLRWPRPWRDPDGRALLGLVLLALASQGSLWLLPHMGLAGELPWSKGAKQCLLLVFLAGMAAAPAWLLRRGDAPAELRRLEGWATAGLLVASLLGLYQALHFVAGMPGGEWLARFSSSNPSYASGSEELYLGHSFTGIPRVRGPAPEPLYLGSYLLLALPLAVAGLKGRARWARAWRLAAIAAGALCLLLGFSRGAWLGGLVSGTLAGVAMARGGLPRPHVPRGAWLAAAAALLLLLAVGPPLVAGVGPHELPGLLLDRLRQSGAGHDMSNLTRFWAWAAAWEAFRQAPLLGVGWGGFGFHYFTLAPQGSGAHFGWPVANNLPLLVLAELGLAGSFLWIRSLAPAVLALPRALAGPGVPPGATLLACGVAGALVHSMTFSQWQLPHLWLGAGLSAALYRERQRLA